MQMSTRLYEILGLDDYLHALLDLGPEDPKGKEQVRRQPEPGQESGERLDRVLDEIGIDYFGRAGRGGVLRAEDRRAVPDRHRA